MDNSVDFVTYVQNWTDREFYKNGDTIIRILYRLGKEKKKSRY